MSAEAFYAFYGIRKLVGAADQTAINLLEHRKHPIQTTAKGHGLEVFWARCADAAQYYVLAGKMIAKLGPENQSSAQIKDDAFNALADDVKAKLRLAGFDESPSLLFEYDIG